MKATIELPDDLITEIKIEAARRKKRLKELVPELLRAGLRAQKGAAGPDRIAMSRWLEEWIEMGAAATRDLPSSPSATAILAADRQRLERR